MENIELPRPLHATQVDIYTKHTKEWKVTQLQASPGQELRHVLFAHPAKHLELFQVAHVRLLILSKGDALNDRRPFQLQN